MVKFRASCEVVSILYVICAYPRNTLIGLKSFVKWYNSLIEEELRLRFFFKKKIIYFKKPYLMM